MGSLPLAYHHEPRSLTEESARVDWRVIEPRRSISRVPLGVKLSHVHSSTILGARSPRKMLEGKKVQVTEMSCQDPENAGSYSQTYPSTPLIQFIAWSPPLTHEESTVFICSLDPPPSSDGHEGALNLKPLRVCVSPLHMKSTDSRGEIRGSIDMVHSAKKPR